MGPESTWLYGSTRCSRKIVGWDVRDTMPEDLVSEALRCTLAMHRPAWGCVSNWTRTYARGVNWAKMHFYDNTI